MTEFETLLTGSMDILRRCVHFRLANPHDAEDVMQETLAAACAAKAYPHDAVRFRAWMLAIARNKIADFLRKKYRRCEVPLDSAAPLGTMPRRLALPWGGMVEEVLSRLPDGDQQLLRSYHHDVTQIVREEMERSSRRSVSSRSKAAAFQRLILSALPQPLSGRGCSA